MGFDQYHEPPEELSQEIRTFARMITSLIEEALVLGMGAPIRFSRGMTDYGALLYLSLEHGFLE